MSFWIVFQSGPLSSSASTFFQRSSLRSTANGPPFFFERRHPKRHSFPSLMPFPLIPRMSESEDGGCDPNAEAKRSTCEASMMISCCVADSSPETRAFWSPTRVSPARTEMIVSTTSISMSVNPPPAGSELRTFPPHQANPVDLEAIDRDRVVVPALVGLPRKADRVRAAAEPDDLDVPEEELAIEVEIEA